MKMIFLKFNMMVGIKKEDPSFPSCKHMSPLRFRPNCLFRKDLILFCEHKSSSKFFMIVFVVVISVSQPIKPFKVNIFITNDLLPDQLWDCIFQMLTLHEIYNGVNGFWHKNNLNNVI